MFQVRANRRRPPLETRATAIGSASVSAHQWAWAWAECP
ncbi:DUF6882 domain-containing protein [Ruegeria faecimaris]